MSYGSGTSKGFRLAMVVPNQVLTQTNQCVNARFGRFVDVVAPHFEQVLIAMSVATPEDTNFFPSRTPIYQYNLKSQNTKVTGMRLTGPADSPLRKLIVILSRLKAIAATIRSSDFVYISLPGWSPLLAQRLCRAMRKPYCLYIAADVSEVAAFTTRWTNLSRPILPSYLAISNFLEQKAVEKSVFALVHGEALMQRFEGSGSRVLGTVPLTTISASESPIESEHIEPPFRCLFVGTVTPRKGVADVVAAIKEVRDRGHEVELDVVGALDEPFASELRRKIRADGLEKIIRFHGYAAEDDWLVDWYRKSHLFVLPTKGEGFPRVLYEAMSQGLPVVTSDIRSIASALKDTCEAILVPPGSPTLLADALIRVLTDSELRSSLVLRGYEFATAALGDAGEQFLSLVSDALN